MNTAARPPSVERVIAAMQLSRNGLTRSSAVEAAREVLIEERTSLSDGGRARSVSDLASAALDRLNAWQHSGMVRALNATGVVIHTNLGRAPWPEAAIAAAADAARGYSLLEFDAAIGRRGPRFPAVEEHLRAVAGAEDGFVLNNNAAALALTVRLAGRGGGVVVSRGELVEIGGGVRIPDVVRRVGARLIEVGTTNRTRASDYEAGIDAGGRLILIVHPSNFWMGGFVERPDIADIAMIARRRNVTVVEDLGSGALIDTTQFGLPAEPQPRERLRSGVDLVTFSGDKLVGGPQAGLVAGRANLVAQIRRDPLARAMRPDKVTLAALAATLALYRTGRAVSDIPIWQMLGASVEALRERAERVVEQLPATAKRLVTVRQTDATVGGGSFPGVTVKSVGIALSGARAGEVARLLRCGKPPVIGRVERGLLVLDMRTVLADEDSILARAIGTALASGSDRGRKG